MKLTLLDMVQRILNDMDSDEVNSIDDTVEAQQVASIIRDCYLEMTSNRNWPHLRKLITLDGLGDSSRPNYLIIPENVKQLESFKYEKHKDGETKINFQDVKYKEPDEFLRIISQRNSDNDNVKVVTDFSGVKLLILNDKAPEYWTSFDDKYIVTDSFDKMVESTHQTSKTQCLAFYNPGWSHTNDSIPDLPSEAFSALLEESKSNAFLVIKQMANQKAEQKSARQQRWLSRKAWRSKGGVQYDDYGRKNRR